MDRSASIFQDLDPSWYPAFSFVVAASPEQEDAISYAIAEAAREDAGVRMRVLDLRSVPAAVHANARAAGPAPRTSVLQVTFYLVADEAAASAVRMQAEMAQWIRPDNGVPEAPGSRIVLVAGTPEEQARAQHLIDDAMAAANFTDSSPAPTFTVVDLR
jgi:hypothetical protein